MLGLHLVMLQITVPPRNNTHQAYNKKAGAGKGKQKSKKFEFTEEQKQEIREAFDLFDTDGSGWHHPS